jgi:hypothetical protein
MNDETRMRKDESSSKAGISEFVIHSTFAILVSSFPKGSFVIPARAFSSFPPWAAKF